MTITAKEMNRIAIARRNEIVVNYFEWNVATKIEAAAAEGKFATSFFIRPDDSVYRHIKEFCAYCHELGFETSKLSRKGYNEPVYFRVSWVNVPEEEVIYVEKYDDFFDSDEEDIII